MSDYTNTPGQRLDLPDPVVTLTGKTMGGPIFRYRDSSCRLSPCVCAAGQAFYSEVGRISWMSDGLHMDTNLGGGGLFGALSRVVTGESLFVVNYTTAATERSSPSATISPARSSRSTWPRARAMIAQKDTLLVAEKSVNMSIAFQKRLGAGLFGGEGFILQKFEGPGTFFASFDGEIVEYTLRPGSAPAGRHRPRGHV